MFININILYFYSKLNVNYNNAERELVFEI